jgi:hypothetical protein
VRAFLEKFADALPEAYEKYKLAWKDIREVRNDLAHCGYRKESAAPSEIMEKLDTHFANLREIHDAVRSMQL